MKYTPRKVFILEDNRYTEITYEELCHKIEDKTTSYAEKLFIPLHGMLMEVTEDAYRDFYKDKRRQKYLKERSEENGDISYDMLTTDEFYGEDILIDDSIDIAAQVERMIMTDKLKQCIALLKTEEYELINALFFRNLSEREWSAETGIPQKTINDRKRRILVKLKKFMEN